MNKKAPRTTPQKRTPKAHSHTARSTKKLMTSLSSLFISVQYEDIDEMVKSTLSLIGEFLKADRSYIFEFNDDRTLMDNTHEWCREGIEPQIDFLKGLPTDMFPFLMERIQGNETLMIPRISELPPEAAAEKDVLEAQNIKSLIIIPLASGKSSFGYIGLDAVAKEMVWGNDTALAHTFAGGIIANALQRQRAEKCIHAELDLAIRLNASTSFHETLRFCLEAAISVSGMDCGGIYLFNKERQELSLTYQIGLSDEFVRKEGLYPADSKQFKLILAGKPVYHHYRNTSSADRESVRREQLLAISIIPITSKGEVIGNLNVASHTLYQVPEYSRKALESVTAHIGAAIMQARHQEEIAAARSNFELLFDTIDDLLFIVDKEGKVIHTNETTQKRLGYSAEEIHGRHVLDFHPTDQRDEAKANVEAMLAGKGDTCRVPLQTAEGTLIPVETRITAAKLNNQPVLFGISRDISERLLSEQSLTESEQRFRQLTDNLPLPLFEINTEGIVTYGNKKSSEVFGYTPEEFADSFSIFRIAIPEEAQKAQKNMAIMARGERSSNNHEYTAIRKDGTTFPLVLYSSAIITNGRFSGVRGVSVDLTDVKKAEETIRNMAIKERMVREFQTLIDNIPGAVYRINEEGKTTILSMVKEFLADFSKEEFEAGLFESMELIHPEDRHMVEHSNRTIGKTTASATLTYRIVSRRGAFRWVEDRRTPAFSSKGEFSGIDGILFDITRRVKTQEEKDALESRLRNTQRLETIGTLAGGIAHDFNNILTPMLGYAEMGLSSLAEEDPLHDYFNEIIHAAERAKNLVGQVLTFSRAQESQPTTVHIPTIIEEALKLLRPSIPATITIQKDIDAASRNILADPSQIHQVIVNLAANAFQAMEESGGILSIKLHEMVPDRQLRRLLPTLQKVTHIHLSITDTGKGMDEATLERIFEPFFTTKSVNKGTGLGLSVVHGIITGYKGEITVESSQGKGTTFHVYLPVIEDKLVAKPEVEPVQGGNGNILFVDDEQATVTMMKTLIPQLGFTIEPFSSPQKALERYHENPGNIDLLITDLTMPGMTGIELAAETHKLNPDLPVILITGYGKDIELTTPINRYGISRFLKKPVRRSELATTINEVISPHNPTAA